LFVGYSGMAIGVRIALGFAAILILTAVVGFIGWNGLNQFSTHVDSSVQTASLATRLKHVESLVLYSKTTRDPAALDQAIAQLAPVREDAASLAVQATAEDQADALTQVADALTTYSESLNRHALADSDSRSKLEGMRSKTNRLERLSDELSALERQVYEDQSKALEAAYADQRIRLEMANTADLLLKATLRARQSEALFRQSREASHAKGATDAIKQMYLTALKLKKLAAGTTEEDTVKQVFAAVNLYRKSLGDLIEAYKLFDEAEDIEARLESNSQRISAFSSTVAAIQRKKYEALRAGAPDGAAAPDPRLEKRAELARLADDLILATLKARQAEAAFRLGGDFKDADRAATEIKPMYMTAIRMNKLASGTDDETAIGKIASGVNDYRKAFEELVTIRQELAVVATVEEGLEKASNDIAAMTTAITETQLAAYETVNQEAEASRTLLEKAVEASAAASGLLSIVRGIRLAETDYVNTAGQGNRADVVRGGSDRALQTTQTLAALLEGSAEAAKVNEIAGLATAYQADFEAVVAALGDATKAEQEMQASLNTVTALVEDIATDETQMMQDKKTFNIATIGVGSALAIVLGLALALLIGRSISRPVGALTSVMERLSHNELEVDVPGENRKNELGAMASTVKIFKDNALQVKRLKREQEEKDRRQAEEKRQTLTRLADEFDRSVGSIVQAVTASAAQMESSAQTMTTTAQEASSRSQTVARAAEETSNNVQTVAAAADEMHKSISEIARQVSESTKISSRAVEEAQRTNKTVSGLAEAAQRIGDVVTLIQDIAEQTNLLALNATIEAARAGDAGKGFAVVASEVKNLAGQTARATEEISQQISDMQGASGNAVEAIGGIGTTIGDISSIANAIASAVEEQGAATQEIARNIQEAARGTGEVSSNIDSVNHAASDTGTTASQILEAAQNLSQHAAALRDQVQKFLDEIRAA